jgi:Ca2+-binding EF-hand superfamily protein
MQISQSSSSIAAYALQRLFSSGETEQTGSFSTEKMPGRQSMPSGEDRPALASGSARPMLSGGSMTGMVAMQYEDALTAETVAADLVSAFDTDKDGSLSASEVETALGSSGVSGDISSLVSELDTDGDSLLSATELSSAIQSDTDSMGARGPDGPPPGGPPRSGPPPGEASSDETALSILEAFDSDEDDSLSLAETLSALGVDDDEDLSSAFSSLDTDGDGGLSSDQLALAIQASMQKQAEGYAAYARQSLA